MEYRFTEDSIKTLSSLPKEIQRRILDKLDFVFSSQNPLKFSKKLNNFECGDYRIRIGDYRASFDMKGKYALFLRFGHRKNFYK
jgi:mRNA-degrading endonuclease RelE of RelBE toxin-antitoxin system